MFHKIWPCGLKPSFFVPWNSGVWLYISGQLFSTVLQKLTKPIKWVMTWRQHKILQFTLYPAFASDFGVSLPGVRKKNLTVETKASLIGEKHTKQIATNSSILSSLCWTALPHPPMPNVNSSPKIKGSAGSKCVYYTRLKESPASCLGLRDGSLTFTANCWSLTCSHSRTAKNQR